MLVKATNNSLLSGFSVGRSNGIRVIISHLLLSNDNYFLGSKDATSDSFKVHPSLH